MSNLFNDYKTNKIKVIIILLCILVIIFSNIYLKIYKTHEEQLKEEYSGKYEGEYIELEEKDISVENMEIDPYNSYKLINDYSEFEKYFLSNYNELEEKKLYEKYPLSKYDENFFQNKSLAVVYNRFTGSSTLNSVTENGDTVNIRYSFYLAGSIAIEKTLYIIPVSKNITSVNFSGYNQYRDITDKEEIFKIVMIVAILVIVLVLLSMIRKI